MQCVLQLFLLPPQSTLERMRRVGGHSPEGVEPGGAWSGQEDWHGLCESPLTITTHSTNS